MFPAMYKLYLSFITSLLVHVHSQTSNFTNDEVCQGISTVVMSLEEVSEHLHYYINHY